MTNKELRTVVGRGQGRAILFLRERGGVGYEELILSLCLKDQTFDHMFENRDDYMCRLADTHPEPLEVVQPLGARLFQSRNRRDRDQIRAILAHLAKKGSAVA